MVVVATRESRREARARYRGTVQGHGTGSRRRVTVQGRGAAHHSCHPRARELHRVAPEVCTAQESATLAGPHGRTAATHWAPSGSAAYPECVAQPSLESPPQEARAVSCGTRALSASGSTCTALTMLLLCRVAAACAATPPPEPPPEGAASRRSNTASWLPVVPAGWEGVGGRETPQGRQVPGTDPRRIARSLRDRCVIAPPTYLPECVGATPGPP